MRQLPARGPGRPNGLSGLFARLIELVHSRDGEHNTLKETLEELIEESEAHQAQITDEERTLLLNALSFGELQVADVMVPRTDIMAAEKRFGIIETIDVMRRGLHTRLPVYNENLDDIVGMAHLKDLLPFWGNGDDFDLEKVMRPVLVVPPSMRVLDLLLEMRDTRSHMAIVVDEFGGTEGLATIDDLVEEIVGEIQDEHDRILPPLIVENADGGLEADARVEVEELEAKLGLVLLEDEHRDDADTLGGLIFTLLDRVPSRGELVRHPCGLEFEVLEADPRRVKRVRINQASRQANSITDDSAA